MSQRVSSTENRHSAMPPRLSPKVPVTTLLKIKACREELDYGDSQTMRCCTFYEDVRVFRRNFRSTLGLTGTSLHDWKSPQHHAGLREMTNAYLVGDGKGALFWPDDPASANYNMWQYSKDHLR